MAAGTFSFGNIGRAIGGGVGGALSGISAFQPQQPVYPPYDPAAFSGPQIPAFASQAAIQGEYSAGQGGGQTPPSPPGGSLDGGGNQNTALQELLNAINGLAGGGGSGAPAVSSQQTREQEQLALLLNQMALQQQKDQYGAQLQQFGLQRQDIAGAETEAQTQAAAQRRATDSAATASGSFTSQGHIQSLNDIASQLNYTLGIYQRQLQGVDISQKLAEGSNVYNTAALQTSGWDTAIGDPNLTTTLANQLRAAGVARAGF